MSQATAAISANNTAAANAHAVLRWAMLPDGPPPQGDLTELAALLNPDAALRQTLGELASSACARLGLHKPQPAGAAPLGIEVLCLAAAIGAAHHLAAIDLVRLCPPATGPVALALHHSLVAPALAHLPPALSEELLLCSPLSALLTLPPPGTLDAAINLCARLASGPTGRRLLVHRLAEPQITTQQLVWRAHLFAVLRAEPGLQGFVLDIYEAAVALHAEPWLLQIRHAVRTLAAPEPEPAALQLAMAVGQWWEAFLALYRANHDAIRERRYLKDFELYLAAIRLAQTTISLREGLR